jgi:hypothetical protein
MSQDMSQVAFSVNAKPQRQSRYTLSNSRETAEGGRVGVGVDAKGNAYLVHEIGRATEAVTLGAVATAIAGGAIPVAALVGAFKETGQLAALKAAVVKELPDPKPEPAKPSK